jgi:hypothetical protein
MGERRGDVLTLDAGDGWHVVYREPAEGQPTATALMRRGAPRGAVRVGNPYHTEIAARVRREVESVGAWYRGSLVAWARRGGWGLIDGVPFDRARVREVRRRYPWAGEVWAVVLLPEGHCLVMRGPRGARALVMCGSEAARPKCAGGVLAGGDHLPW